MDLLMFLNSLVSAIEDLETPSAIYQFLEDVNYIFETNHMSYRYWYDIREHKVYLADNN